MKGSLKMEDEQQKGYQETVFGEYKRKVVECLMKDEGLTEAEARDWMSGEDENLRKYLQEGLDPLTAARVLLA